jgi:TPP-dependent pyruvate/acetoin dehydrogenase alpha subunit
MNHRNAVLFLASACASLALVSCETAGEGAKKGAMYGAAAGVAKGILDDKEGNVLKSGVIGAGVGAGAGAAVGASRNKNNSSY